MQKPNQNHTSNNNKRTNHVGANCVRHNSSGITLIALIITIIIMIILVGVTVNIALNGGLFSTAKQAAKETEYQADYETLQAAIVAAMDENLQIPTAQDLQDNLPSGWSVEGTDGVEYIVTSPNGNTFMVDANANIEDYVEVEKVMDEYPGDITDNGTRDGTESNPYMINSMEDLVAFAELVDMGDTCEGKIVKLGYNLDFNSNNSYVNPNEPYTSKEKGEQIDINENGTIESIKTEVTTGKGFDGIGEVVWASGSGPVVSETSYKGTFDGNNKIISNFYQNIMLEMQGDEGNITPMFALFEENEGTIKNLGIKLAKNSIQMSGLVGCNGNNTMIDDLENTNISASIENCFCVISEGSYLMSGLVGINGGTIKNSYTSGRILSSMSETLGGEPPFGICLESYGGAIKNCYSLMLKEDGSNIISPLIDRISYNESTVKTTIENCYNPSGIIVGSIGGGATVDIKNCYALGNVTGVRGGIVGSSGDRYSNLTTITLDNCYFKGRIDYTTDYSSYDVDGLVGDRGDKVTITNSKYLEKSLYLNGELQPDDENAATEEEMNTYMKSVLEVVNGDGAFKEDTNNINNGYPILSWQ